MSIRVYLLVICLCALVAVDVSAEERPLTAAEMKQEIIEMLGQTTFLNKRFRYKVKGYPYKGSLDWGDYGLEFPEHGLEGVRELVVCEPLPPSKTIRYLLTHYVPNPGQPCDDREEIEAFWKGYDGRQFRLFTAFYFRDPVFRDFHTGAISSSNDISLLFTDPLHKSIYGGINHRFCGLADMEIRYDIFLKDRFVKQAEYPEWGKCHETTWVYESQTFKSIKLTGPEHCFVDWEQSPRNYVKVKQLREVGGLRYPALGETADDVCKWEFELLSVEDVTPPKGDEAWFPEWPHGTAVNDQENQKVHQIPYTAEERKAIERYELQKLKGFGGLPRQWSLFYIINLGLIAVIIAALGYQFYRKLRTA